MTIRSIVVDNAILKRALERHGVYSPSPSHEGSRPRRNLECDWHNAAAPLLRVLGRVIRQLIHYRGSHLGRLRACQANVGCCGQANSGGDPGTGPGPRRLDSENSARGSSTISSKRYFTRPSLNPAKFTSSRRIRTSAVWHRTAG